MAKARTKQIASVKEFRRLIHSQSDLRTGINFHRASILPSAIAPIITNLFTNPIYAKQIAVEPFPKDVTRIRPTKPMRPVSAAIDLVWNAAVLSAFHEEINDFISLRSSFEHCLLTADYDSALKHLDSVEKRFGYSFWLIDCRLRTLQLKDGLATQKAYLEQLLNSGDLQSFIASIIFYLSYSAEERVSLSDLNHELDELTTGGTLREIVDYFRTKINPFDFTQVETPWRCVSYDETSPIIDRFQTFTSMVQLETATSLATNKEWIIQAIALLQNINEPRLTNLFALLTSQWPPPRALSPSSLSLFDEYTSGNYDSLARSSEALLLTHAGCSEFYELTARARAYAEGSTSSLKADSLAAMILKYLQSLFELREDVQAARFQLQKLAILVRHTSVANDILSIVARAFAPGVRPQYEKQHILSALSGSLDNPWNLSLLSNLSAGWLEKVLANNPDSITLKLYDFVDGRYDLETSLSGISSLRMPDYRKLRYSGYSALVKGHYDSASPFFEKAISQGGTLQFVLNAGLLCDTYLKAGQTADALALISRAYLKNPNTHLLFPLEKILQASREQFERISQPLHYAIAAHVYSRHLGTDFDSDLSDAFELTLAHFNASRPSDIDLDTNTLTPELIFFLSNICVIRVLEDSTSFYSVEDIELERIRLLQRLIEIDPAKEDIYTEEIGSITRDMEISRLFQSFETSRVYADENGIVRSIETPLRDSFARYMQLLQDPKVGYQATDIARRLKELLDKEDTDPDLRRLHLPSTEQEGLFESMHSMLLDSFVLNPDHGLKTYLSTNILHGALEGELRSSLSKRGLLFVSSDSGTDDQIKAFWSNTLSAAVDADWALICKALGRFSERIAHRIAKLRTDVIRIRTVDSPEGVFNFVLTRTETDELRRRLVPGTTFENFISIMFKSVWERVDHSLEAVKLILSNDFSAGVMQDFTTLQSAVDSDHLRAKTAPLLDEISHARIGFDLDVQRVTGWFSRADKSALAPFQLETAFAVAVKVTNNCFPRTLIAPTSTIEVPVALRGQLLDAFVYILHNCLQNAVQRSGLHDRAPKLSLDAKIDNRMLVFRLSNELANSIDLNERRNRVAEFLNAAGSTVNAAAVSKEGGSGLKKIFRSLRTDLGVEPCVNCSITDDFFFHITIEVPINKVANADLLN